MKNPNDTIGDGTRERPACNAVEFINKSVNKLMNG
jgi:hypothetical protein